MNRLVIEKCQFPGVVFLIIVSGALLSNILETSGFSSVIDNIDNSFLRELYRALLYTIFLGVVTLVAAKFFNDPTPCMSPSPTAHTPLKSLPHPLVGVYSAQGGRQYQEDRFATSVLPYTSDSTHSNNHTNPLRPFAASVVTSIKHQREHKRDRAIHVICPHKTTLVSVFDGHGGALASHIAADHLHTFFTRDIANQLAQLNKASMEKNKPSTPPIAPTNAAAQLQHRAFTPQPPPAPKSSSPPVLSPALSRYCSAPPQTDALPSCHPFAPLSLAALEELSETAPETRSGKDAARDALASSLAGQLTEEMVEAVDVAAALTRAYLRTDALIDAATVRTGSADGCTAVSACVWSGALYVAHAGDARAVLVQQRGIQRRRSQAHNVPDTPGYTPSSTAGSSSGGGRYQAVALTADHTPMNEQEAARVLASGGRLIHNRGLRVEGVLTVSRALGDRTLKPFVLAEPALAVRPVERGDCCVVLASDGLWDTVEPEDVAQMLAQIEESPAFDHTRISCNCVRASNEGTALPHGAGAAVPAGSCVYAHVPQCRYVNVRTLAMDELARRLVSLALQRGSRDNVTAIAMDLTIAASVIDF